MKFIHAIIFLAIFSNIAAQQSPRYYELHELADAPIDSVLAINLKKLKLTELPEEIFRFKNIQYLDISKNNFRQLKELEKFPNLKYLNIEKCKLEFFPFGICQLTKLETLILNRNPLENIPSCIGYCSELQYIDLYYTAVTLLPEEMSYLEKLSKIDLTGVQINEKNQERIRGLFKNVEVKLSPPCKCTQ